MHELLAHLYYVLHADINAYQRHVIHEYIVNLNCKKLKYTKSTFQWGMIWKKTLGQIK